MSVVHRPLTVESALTTGHLDVVTLGVCLVVLAAYWWAWRRSTVSAGRGAVFTVMGVGVWVVSTASFVGAYADVLFWVRALQVVILLLIVPFGLAAGMPLTVARDALGPRGRRRFDAAMASRAARVLTYPAVTSAAVLITPWLFYLTGWYSAVLRGTALDIVTRLLFVAIGFGYFWSRLQVDPVPRRFPQALSLLITLVETIGDGLLGVVIWQGGDIAHGWYAALDRTWGPSLRTDQIIGAGILWVLGDVVGLPFLLTLMSRFRTEQTRRALEIDAEIDAQIDAGRPPSATSVPAGDDAGDRADADAPPALWWETDATLRDRFR